MLIRDGRRGTVIRRTVNILGAIDVKWIGEVGETSVEKCSDLAPEVYPRYEMTTMS